MQRFVLGLTPSNVLVLLVCVIIVRVHWPETTVPATHLAQKVVVDRVDHLVALPSEMQ
jgi:hypothetical protein